MSGATATLRKKQPRRRPRTCVACRFEAPKEALVRIVRTPSGEAVLDVTGKLPGRGAYVCMNGECLKKARKTGALSRALKTTLTDACWEELERCVERYGVGRDAGEIARELSSLIGLARAAGMAVIGLDSIHAEMRKTTARPLFLMLARDSSESVREAAGKMGDVLTLPLNIEELSGALGAGNVQVIALPARNGLTARIKALTRE